MSGLEFSSDELDQFSALVGDIKVPGFADDSGGSLRGLVSGSEVAAATYDQVAAAAATYLDLARRGLEAFQQVSKDISQTFHQRDNVSATEMDDAWTKENGPLLANNANESRPAVPQQSTGSTVLDQLIQQLQGGK
jgi:hypothetical protein